MKVNRLLLSLAMGVSMLTPVYNVNVEAKNNYNKVEFKHDFVKIQKVENNNLDDGIWYYITSIIDENGNEKKGLLASDYTQILEPVWDVISFDAKLNAMTSGNIYSSNSRISYYYTDIYENSLVVETSDDINVINCEEGKYCSYYYQDDYIVQKMGNNISGTKFEISDDFNLYDNTGEFVLNASDEVMPGEPNMGYEFYVNSAFPEYIQLTSYGISTLVKVDLKDDKYVVTKISNDIILPKDGYGLFFDIYNREYKELNESGEFVTHSLLDSTYRPISEMVGGKSFVIHMATGSDLSNVGDLVVYNFSNDTYTDTGVSFYDFYYQLTANDALIVDGVNENKYLVNLKAETLNVTEVFEKELKQNTGNINGRPHNGMYRFEVYIGGDVGAVIYVFSDDLDSYEIINEPTSIYGFSGITVTGGGTLQVNNLSKINVGSTNFDWGTSYMGINTPQRTSDGHLIVYNMRDDGQTEFYKLIYTSETNSIELQYITTKKYSPLLDRMNVLESPNMSIFVDSGKIVKYKGKGFEFVNSPKPIDGLDTLLIETIVVVGDDTQYNRISFDEIYDNAGNLLYTNVGKGYYIKLQNRGSEYAKAVNSKDKNSFIVQVFRNVENKDENYVSQSYALMNEQFKIISDEYRYIEDLTNSLGVHAYRVSNYDYENGLLNDEGELIIPFGNHFILPIFTNKGDLYYLAKGQGEGSLYDAEGNRITDYEGNATGIVGNVVKSHVILKIDGKNKLFKFGQKKAMIEDADSLAEFTTKGLAKICRNKKCGFINEDGKEVIKADYDDVLSFYANQAFVYKNGEWFVINDKNKKQNVTIGNPSKEVRHVEHFDEKYVVVTYDDDTSALVDRGTLEEVGITGSNIELAMNDGEDAYIRVGGASTFSLLRNSTVSDWYVMPISEEDEQTPYVDDSNEGGSSSSGSSSGSSGGSGGGGGGGSTVKVPTTPQATIPTTTIVKALKKEESVSVKLTKSSEVPNTILDAIKGTDKTVTFEVVDENKEVAYSMTLNGNSITDTKSFNMDISFVSENEATIKTLTKKSYEVLEFAHSGALPGVVQVKIKTEYKPTDKVNLVYFNEVTKMLEVVKENVSISEGYATFEIDHCSTYLLVLDSELDLSDYTNELLPVYENSRATSIKSTNTGIEVAGYAFIKGTDFNKKDSLWREIIFVNEEDTSKAKAYRMQVTSVYNTFLNSNKNINPNGTLSYAYANYTVQVNPNAIKDYVTNSTYQKMASGSYRVYIRVSDGKNGKLFPLKDIVLSDGSTLTLPSGFELVDETTRELRYVVK